MQSPVVEVGNECDEDSVEILKRSIKELLKKNDVLDERLKKVEDLVADSETKLAQIGSDVRAIRETQEASKKLDDAADMEEPGCPDPAK